MPRRRREPAAPLANGEPGPAPRKPRKRKVTYLTNGEHEPTWITSATRTLMEQDIKSGTIPMTKEEMPDREVYSLRPEYLLLPFDSFPRRLNALRDLYQAQLNRGMSDAAAFENDRRFAQQPTFAALGLPRWAGSDAERYLKIDIAAELHLQMTPQALRATRDEYMLFGKTVFREHIHQEVKRCKFIKSFYGRDPA